MFSAVFLLLVVMSSCDTECEPLDCVDPPIIEVDSFSKQLFNFHFMPVVRTGTGVLQNKDLIFFQMDEDDDQNLEMISYNKSDRKIRWKINNGEDFGTGSWFVFENHLILWNGEELVGINTISGEIEWRKPNYNWAVSFTSFENKLYLIREVSQNIQEIIELNPQSGDTSDQLFSYQIDEEDYESLRGLNLMRNDEDDLVAIFQSRRQTKSNVFRVNLTQSEIEFVSDTLNEISSGSTSPQIHNNKIYHWDNVKMQCRNIDDGSLIWEKRYNFQGAGLINAKPYFEDNRMYFSFLGNYKMLCLNSETGDHIWENEEIKGDFSNINEHEGFLYFTAANSGQFHKVDKHTGELLGSLYPPVYEEVGLGYDHLRMAFDEEREEFYILDYASFTVWGLND